MKKKGIKFLTIFVFILITGIVYTKYYGPSIENKAVQLDQEDSNHPQTMQSAREDSSKEDDKMDATLEQNMDSKEADKDVASNDGSEQNEVTMDDHRKDSLMVVHICGAVNNPGVYQVPASSRLIDVVELAGGLLEDAAEEYINLAQSVEDGTKFYIPTVSEMDSENKMDLIQVDALASGNEKTSETEPKDLVNINTANKDELMNIPGIGDAKAEAIIEFRTNQGKFATVEDVMNIRGIKEGLFRKMKDYITVG